MAEHDAIETLQEALAITECPACGYSLQGHQRGSICPECGFDSSGYQYCVPTKTGAGYLYLIFAVFLLNLVILFAQQGLLIPSNRPIRSLQVIIFLVLTTVLIASFFLIRKARQIRRYVLLSRNAIIFGKDHQLRTTILLTEIDSITEIESTEKIRLRTRSGNVHIIRNPQLLSQFTNDMLIQFLHDRIAKAKA